MSDPSATMAALHAENLQSKTLMAENNKKVADLQREVTASNLLLQQSIKKNEIKLRLIQDCLNDPSLAAELSVVLTTSVTPVVVASPQPAVVVPAAQK